MATPTPKRPAHRSPVAAPLPDVDPRWLLKALGVTIAAAVLLAYLTLCLLIYQGSWQLLLHPSSTIDATPTIPFESIRFDSAATGQPRLTGWWIPAGTPGRPTILFLHDGRGSLSANVNQLTLLHAASVNIFAIDYRGFGLSDPPHPTEARMIEDAAAALDYLVATRHIPAASIVPYGHGLGAALAAQLAQSHPELPALIVDNPDPNAAARAIYDRRSHLVPMRLLLRDRFNLDLHNFTRPKLLIAGGPGDSSHRDPQNEPFFKSLPDPKMTVTLHPPPENYPCPASPPPGSDPRLYSSCLGPAYIASITRFLDAYLPAGIDTLTPAGTP